MARTKDFNEEEVLGKAVQLFWHKGYNGASMQDLVAALGISRSSLYDTYGDKHALFIKALERYQAVEAIKRHNILNGPAPAKDAIRQLLELSTFEMLGDKLHKGCFLVNTAIEIAPHDKVINNMIRQSDRQIKQAFLEAIKKGQDNGEIPTRQDAAALTRFIFNTVLGLRVSVKVTTDKAVFEDIIRLTLSILD